MNAQQNTPAAILRPEFIFLPEDRAALESLPDNLPDTKLTAKQKETVSRLYYKYISKNQLFHGWGTELFEIEKKEKWPSGPRVKDHEAKRFILENLLSINEKGNMTPTEAARYFHNVMTCRPMFVLLVQKVYNIDSLYQK